MKKPTPPAVVIGVDVSALNVIRSLGRRGIEVYALGTSSADYGAASRYARFVKCDSLYDEEEVVSKLIDFSQQLGRRTVLFGTSDLHVLFISKNRERLERHYDYVLPDHDVIETLMDKRKFYDFASRAGLHVPRTFFSRNRREFEEIAPLISHPCAVKPLYRTRFWSVHVPPQKKVMRMKSLQDTREKLEQLGALNESLIFQEWVPGGDGNIYFCLAYLDRQGKPLASLCGRKIRQYPSLTGVTSLAVTIKEPHLRDISMEILCKAKCRGLCSVEFKKDGIDGSFKITEPTVGRVDLQEGLTARAGIDIPFIAYKDALGISQGETNGYESGIKWVNEPFELNSFLNALGENRTEIGKFFEPYRTGRLGFALLARDDPRPFLHFSLWAGKRGFRYLKKVVPSK